MDGRSAGLVGVGTRAGGLCSGLAARKVVRSCTGSVGTGTCHDAGCVRMADAGCVKKGLGLPRCLVDKKSALELSASSTELTVMLGMASGIVLGLLVMNSISRRSRRGSCDCSACRG